MEQAFEDLRIVEHDTRRTTWSRVHESMRVVYLRLNSAPPDMEWTRLFHEERESRINPLRCGLWIEEDSISFDCLLRDIESGHIPDIQRSIDFANRKYREVLTLREQQRRERHDENVDEAQTLATLRARVRAIAGEPAPKPAPARVRDHDRASPGDVPPTQARDVQPAPATQQPTPITASFDEELERRRQLLRAQYRAAAKNPKEKDRGDD
jgi:hypothetical protein